MAHFDHINKGLYKTGGLMKKEEFHGLTIDIEDEGDSASEIITTDIMIQNMNNSFETNIDAVEFLLDIVNIHPTLSTEDMQDISTMVFEQVEG